MEEKIKEINNQELLQLYNMVNSHIEYLNTEKEKVNENEKPKDVEDDKK